LYKNVKKIRNSLKTISYILKNSIKLKNMAIKNFKNIKTTNF